MHIKIISSGEIITLDAFYALHPTKTFGGLPSDAQLADEGAEYWASPPTVPESVTMRQARLALLQIGKTNAVVVGILNQLPESEREKAKIEWEFSSIVERQRPLVLSLGPALGLDAAALDALFITAAGL